jgi:hydroxypyruvate reductase
MRVRPRRAKSFLVARIQNRAELLAHARDALARERRAQLCDLFDAALEAVDPVACTRRALRALRERGIKLERVTLFAFGKAARGMAEAALAEAQVTGGMVIALDDAPLEALSVARGSHPLPHEGAPAQGEAMLNLARSLGPNDLALVLVSGGGSAMLELPLPHITLDELAQTTRVLLASGASIDEINAIRAVLSQVKGGKLARAMPHSKIVNVLLSDVVGAPASAIASGPTLEPSADAPLPRDVLARYDLFAKLPAHVVQTLMEAPAPARSLPNVTTVMAADNTTAQAAMVSLAKSRGWAVTQRAEPMVGEARVTALELLAEARAHGTLYIAGGETTVTLRTQGVGGRNHELALAALGHDQGSLLAALGTDGVDGSSGAAGAIADASALACAQALGLDRDQHLAEHMSGPYFAASHAAIVTGPTGTNVADVVAIFSAPPREN